MARQPPVIAIDGPSGSGKGTIARRVAAALGWHLLGSSQRLAEQYRWNGHWKLLEQWLQQLDHLS